MAEKKKLETPKKEAKKRGPPSATDWHRPFIAALRNSGNVRAACVAAKVSRGEAYRDRENDEGFKAEWDEAVEDAVDALEAIARQRAANSSDTLLIFLLKAHRPEKYRENIKQEISGPNNGPIPMMETPEELRNLPADELVKRYRAALGSTPPVKS